MPIQKCKKPHENTEKFFTVGRRNQRLPLFDRQFGALPVGNSKIPSVSREFFVDYDAKKIGTLSAIPRA